MHFNPRHLVMILLALTAISCEHEEISYPSPKQQPEETKDTTTVISPDPYEGSSHPTNENIIRIAKTLCGEWHGEMEIRFFDEYGVLNQSECSAQFTFSQDKEGTANGIGKETDFINGKTVFNMSFNWYVGDDEVIHLRYVDKTQRHTTSYHLDNDTFSGQMKTNDGWEECHFSLSRKK